jgi:hypothetical protein
MAYIITGSLPSTVSIIIATPDSTEISHCSYSGLQGCYSYDIMQTLSGLCLHLYGATSGTKIL